MLKLKFKLTDLNKGKKDTLRRSAWILFKSMLKMEKIAQDLAPVDIGQLRQKISLDPIGIATEYTLTSAAPYSASMEFGTIPYWVPIAPLKEWAKRKLGDENIAYAVRAKIAQSGITAHPFMRPAKFTVESIWVPIYRQQAFI